MSEACSTQQQQEEECTSQQILKDTLENPFEFAQEQINLMQNRILKLEQEVQALKNGAISKQALESSSPDTEEVVVELRTDISLEEVKKQVLTYVKSHKHSKTSDIIFDLGIDPELVVEALETLEKEKAVVSRDIQTVFQ